MGSLTDAQKEALRDAIDLKAVHVEIRITKGTQVGTRGKKAAFKKLQSVVDAEFGEGALKPVEEIGAGYLSKATADAAEKAKGETP